MLQLVWTSTFKKSKNNTQTNDTETLPDLITQVTPNQKHRKTLPSLSNFTSCFGFLRKCFMTTRRSFTSSNLLGPQPAHLKGKKTLVLDLDETLIHSSYGYTRNPDIVLPIRAEGVTHMIHIKKRPGVEKFLARVSELYEVVVFTASLGEYAAPLMKKLDKEKKVSALLFREACTVDNGYFVKDLSRLGRDLKNVILIDNAVKSFEFQPENAIHIKDFFDDNSDNELEKLLPVLEYLATEVDDVRPVSANIKSFNKMMVKAKAKLSNPNQEQASPNAQKQKKSSFKRKGKRKESEKLPLAKVVEIVDQESPREEIEALQIIRNLSLRRTILKNQLKALDKVTVGSAFNPTTGSACTATTASNLDKEISASIQTPEFYGGQRLDHFADTPEAGEGEAEGEDRQEPIEKNGGMLSRILEFAEMKKQEYERFDSENDECEKKTAVIECGLEGGEGTMQELLNKEEGNEVTFLGYSEQEIKSESEIYKQAVQC